MKCTWSELITILVSGHAAQHSVHPTGGSLRVFKPFAWLEAGSGKMTLSRPSHQRVTQAVGRFIVGANDTMSGKEK